MKSVLIYLIVCVCVAMYDANKFRCDYTYFRGGNGWFKIHTEAKTWNDASYTCYLEGAELAAPTSAGIKDAMMSLIYDNYGVLLIHTARHPPATARTFVAEEEAIGLSLDGSDRRVSQNDYLPFICRRVGEEDIKLNECGTLDDGYKLDKRTGHCYKFHDIQSTWYEAGHICSAEGGQLAIINSDTESQVIKDVFIRSPVTPILKDEHWYYMAFLGFSTIDGVTWKTLDGVTLKQAGFDTFSAGEPNNARGDEFCGSVGRNGLLFDDPCTRRMSFICEKEIYRGCNDNSLNQLTSLRFGASQRNAINRNMLRVATNAISGEA